MLAGERWRWSRGNSSLRLHLGRLLARAERLGEAEDAFGEALALAPDDGGIRGALEQVRARRAALPTQAVPPEPVSTAAKEPPTLSHRQSRREAKRLARRQRGL